MVRLNLTNAQNRQTGPGPASIERIAQQVPTLGSHPPPSLSGGLSTARPHTDRRSHAGAATPEVLINDDDFSGQPWPPVTRSVQGITYSTLHTNRERLRSLRIANSRLNTKLQNANASKEALEEEVLHYKRLIARNTWHGDSMTDDAIRSELTALYHDIREWVISVKKEVKPGESMSLTCITYNV